MASSQVRKNSGDAPEVYYPPSGDITVPDERTASARAALANRNLPAPPAHCAPADVNPATLRGTSPELYYPTPAPTPSSSQRASDADLGYGWSHLPTPPANCVRSDVESDAWAKISSHTQESQQQQQLLDPRHPASPPSTQLTQHPNTFPLTPISPPSSHLFTASSPGYFQTTSYESQYFPPPPSPGSTPAPQEIQSQHQHQPLHTASYHITSPSLVPAGNVQYAPSYAPQQIASPQQYFPPPPPSSSSSTTTYTSHISSKVIPTTTYFPPPPPSAYSSAAASQASLPTSPYLAQHPPIQPLSSPILSGSRPYGAPHQNWPGVSTQSLPNSHMNAHSSSYNVAVQNDMSHSLSNLSLANQATAQHSIPAASDDVTEHWSKRFVGNTLAGRVVRASVKSVAATVQLPIYLSPWGDNNPVTLPNVRRRDAALAVVGHLGADALAPSALELTGEALKFGATQAAEKTVDDGIHHFAPSKAAAVKLRNGVRSTQVKIKHKLMGSDANLRYVGGRTALHPMEYSKGWFCPLLFASGRTPSIPRANDFTVAEFHGPGLSADTELTRSLVELLSQDLRIDSLCPTDPMSCNAPNRLLVLLLGLSPCRTQAWSQARIPGEARLQLHLFTGVPAFVLPVTAKAPISAWSPWTLKQMHGNNGKGSVYSPETQYHELCQYLEGVVHTEQVAPSYRGQHQAKVGNSIWAIIQGALGTRSLGPGVMSAVDSERAGIAMLRY